MKTRNKTALLSVVLCAVLGLSACTGSRATVRDDTLYALPDAVTAYAAPIGDATLAYTKPAVFYLPRHDSDRLIAVTDTIAFSEGRLTAESLARLLLEQPGSAIASPLGGNVKLSLYGANPLEISGDVATVNLAASALQLDRKTLFLISHAITNTLTEMEEIQYVNTLVMDKKLALDLSSTLPVGVMTRSLGEDIGALYEQQLSYRVQADDNPADKRYTATVALYFPLSAINGIMTEARSITFTSMDMSDMTITLLQALADGAGRVKGSPAMSLLPEYLTEVPMISQPEGIGGNLITLRFNDQLNDMLQATGISRASFMASLCYTLTTFLPNVAGMEVYIDAERVEHVMLTGISGILFDDGGIQKRVDFAPLLMDNCTLYFPDTAGETLTAVERPVPFYQTTSPRALLGELFYGPAPADSKRNARAVLPAGTLKDSDIIGIALDGDALLVNFSNTFTAAGQGMTADEDRLLAYSLVNTLLHASNARRVVFFAGGNPIENFTDAVYWKGWFVRNIGIVTEE